MKKQAGEMKKILTSLVDKDDYITKLNKKISQLRTKDLSQLSQKMVTMVNQSAQTEEEKWEDEQNSDRDILNKLPSMKRLGNSTIQQKGKQFLNVNVTRGVKDRCFNCFDLEHKVAQTTKTCNQLKKEVNKYQEQLGKVNLVYQSDHRLTSEVLATEPGKDRNEELIGKEEQQKVIEVGGDENKIEDKEKGEEGELEKDIEDQVKAIRNSASSKKQEKDHSKLCYRWIWSGKCDYPNCKFTHKKLCKRLRKIGECDLEECQDGHSTDGICWRYNSKDGCRFGSEYCKFLHITVKSMEVKEQNRKVAAKEKAEENQEEEDENQEKDSEQRKKERKEAESGIEEEYVSTKYQWSNCDVSACYDKEYYAEKRTQEKSDPTEEEEKIEMKRTLGKGKKENSRNEETRRNDKRRVSFKEQQREQKDNGESFLEIDSRHDVWKQIKGLKTEIRYLEREMRKVGRRSGGRDL